MKPGIEDYYQNLLKRLIADRDAWKFQTIHPQFRQKPSKKGMTHEQITQSPDA